MESSPIPSLLADLAVFVAGAALIAAAVRWWRPGVSLRAAAAYAGLTLAVLAPALATPSYPVATDLAYQWPPWKGTLEEEVRPQNPLLGDPVFQMLPFRALVRERLFHQRPPLWAHGLATGQPLLGNAQSAPFSPLELLALPLPPLRSMAVSAAWQVLLSLLLMHALMLRLGAASTGAAFAALSFALSSFAVAWRYYPLGMASAWAPGVFLGLVLLRGKERGAFAGLVVCATGMALSGHPETTAHTALAAAVVVVWLGLRGRSGRGRFAGELLVAALVSLCLAAPALLPFFEALAGSQRFVSVSAPGLGEGVHPPPFEARLLATAVDPFVLGSPRDGDWSGPRNFNEVATTYAGLLPLALGLAAGLRRRGLPLLLGAVAALLIALRIEPLFSLVDGIPGLEHAVHGRLRLFWILALAAAAGRALDGLATHGESGWGRRGWVAAGCLTAAGLGLAWLAPPPGLPWRWAWWGATLLGAAAALLTFSLRRTRRWFPRVALVALAADLVLMGARYNPVVEPRLDLAAPPAVRFLARRSAGVREPFRVVGEAKALRPNLGALYGLWDTRGNDPMRPAAAALFLRKGLGPSSLPPPEADRGLHAFLRVRYAVTGVETRLPPPWRPAFRGGGTRVWRNPRVLPLFFTPESVRPSADWRRALAAARRLPDLARAVTVVGPVQRTRQRPSRVWLEAVEANGFSLQVESEGALVASSVSSAPGWRALVGGRRVPTRRVDGAFLGFEVPGGVQRVRLRFLPSGWVWGLGLAALGLAVFVARTVVPPVPRHRASPVSNP